MIVIRLQRTGKRNMAYFRMVVADKARAVSGKFLEVLGSIDPHTKKIQLNKERISYWLSVGAQPSDSAHNLLINEGLIKGKKRAVKIKKKLKEGEEATGTEQPTTPEEPKAEAAPSADSVKPVEAKPEDKAEVKAEVKAEPKEESKAPATEEVKKEESKPEEKPAANEEKKPVETEKKAEEAPKELK